MVCIHPLETHPQRERERERAQRNRRERDILRRESERKRKGGGPSRSQISSHTFSFWRCDRPCHPSGATAGVFSPPTSQCANVFDPICESVAAAVAHEQGPRATSRPFFFNQLIVFSSDQGKSQPLSRKEKRTLNFATTQTSRPSKFPRAHSYFPILPVKRTLSRRKGAEAPPRGHGCTSDMHE